METIEFSAFIRMHGKRTSHPLHIYSICFQIIWNWFNQGSRFLSFGIWKAILFPTERYHILRESEYQVNEVGNYIIFWAISTYSSFVLPSKQQPRDILKVKLIAFSQRIRCEDEFYSITLTN